MTTDRDDVILEAAEGVVAGLIALQAAEAGLANERERADLRSLVRALTVVRSHAAALAHSAGAPGPAPAPTDATQTSLDVPPARVHARHLPSFAPRYDQLRAARVPHTVTHLIREDQPRPRLAHAEGMRRHTSL